MVVVALLEKELTMDQRQEKASRTLGEATHELVQSGLFGATQAVQMRGCVNGEMTDFMVVVFAQTPAVVDAIKERVLTAAPHERTALDAEHRGMAELGNMLTQRPGGKPFVFDNGPSYHQFVGGPSGSGMSHAAAAEIVKSNCKMSTKLHIVPSGQES